MRLKILYTTRKYSTLQGIAPEEARDRYPQLITMDPESNFSLTGGFKQAIAEAQKLESEGRGAHLRAPWCLPGTGFTGEGRGV